MQVNPMFEWDRTPIADPNGHPLFEFHETDHSGHWWAVMPSPAGHAVVIDGREICALPTVDEAKSAAENIAEIFGHG